MISIEYRERSTADLISELTGLGQPYSHSTPCCDSHTQTPHAQIQVHHQSVSCSLPSNEEQRLQTFISQLQNEVSSLKQQLESLKTKLHQIIYKSGLSDIYSICQREKAILQQKLTQSQNHILTLTTNASDQELKGIVRRLTLEIQQLQRNSGARKIVQSRLIFLQKQLAEEQEQKAILARSEEQLAQQNQRLLQQAKRLKLTLQNKATVQPPKSHGNQRQKNWLQQTPAGSRQEPWRARIVECNDFLVQFLAHMEQKLGAYDSTVLDCNKFVRGFLVRNLNLL